MENEEIKEDYERTIPQDCTQWNENTVFYKLLSGVKWMNANENNIWVQNYYDDLGLFAPKLKIWCQKSARINDLFHKVQEFQKNLLIKKALEQKSDTKFIILLLQNHYGWQKSSEIESKTPEDKPNNPEEFNKMIDSLLSARQAE